MLLLWRRPSWAPFFEGVPQVSFRNPLPSVAVRLWQEKIVLYPAHIYVPILRTCHTVCQLITVWSPSVTRIINIEMRGSQVSVHVRRPSAAADTATWVRADTAAMSHPRGPQKRPDDADSCRLLAPRAPQQYSCLLGRADDGRTTKCDDPCCHWAQVCRARRVHYMKTVLTDERQLQRDRFLGILNTSNLKTGPQESVNIQLSLLTNVNELMIIHADRFDKCLLWTFFFIATN